jgi:hypothetical protein
MNTQIAIKLTSFAAALVMNSLIALGVGALFNVQAPVQPAGFASTAAVQTVHEGA